ncbi:hypothetical protein ACNUIU_33180 [Pseudomonas aeruginosa]|uniref:hypothetical protein n=2 Tax=Pseudomonas aeruginosa TaxID=287 RepID=UPI001ABC5345|nr:hypothetical protein [Pseudomonas aeruginosa]MBR7846353.1 hypothetical protein [Pseudomonas aeruginosa]
MNKALDLLHGLVREVERKTCCHEETHRGGAIWEICDSCGAKWADDEGGKPEFAWPESVEKAREFLATHPAVEQAGGDERAAFDAYRDRRNALLESEGHKPGSKWHVTNAHYPTWEASRAALAQPSQKCATCNGTGLIDDGEITCSEGGIPYENGPVKCVKDCPDCKAQPSPAPELERPEGVAYLFVKPDGTLSMDAVRHKPSQPAVAVMTVAQHERIVGELRAVIAQLRQHKNDYMDSGQETYRALQNEIREREAEIARLDGLVSGRTAERDAALAEVKRIKTISDNYYALCVERQQQLDAALAMVSGLRSLLNPILCYVENDIERMRGDRDKSDNKETYDLAISLAMKRLKAAQHAVFTTEPGCNTAVELASHITAQAQRSVPGDIMRDAQRYRWLRDQQFYFSFSTENSDAGISSCTAGMSSRFKNLSWVDAAIDSAIAAAPGKEVGHE